MTLKCLMSFCTPPIVDGAFCREHESISGTCGAVGLEGSRWRWKKLRAKCRLTFAAACVTLQGIAVSLLTKCSQPAPTNNLRRHNRVTVIWLSIPPCVDHHHVLDVGPYMYVGNKSRNHGN